MRKRKGKMQQKVIEGNKKLKTINIILIDRN